MTLAHLHLSARLANIAIADLYRYLIGATLAVAAISKNCLGPFFYSLNSGHMSYPNLIGEDAISVLCLVFVFVAVWTKLYQILMYLSPLTKMLIAPDRLERPTHRIQNCKKNNTIKIKGGVTICPPTSL